MVGGIHSLMRLTGNSKPEYGSSVSFRLASALWGVHIISTSTCKWGGATVARPFSPALSAPLERGLRTAG